MRGFGDRQMDGQTDMSICRVAFASEKLKKIFSFQNYFNNTVEAVGIKPRKDLHIIN